jgi:hypothetical protein
MSGELCGPGCGWCSRCDGDYGVRCLTPGCDNPVSLPEWDTYCAECRDAQQLRAQAIGQVLPPDYMERRR